MKVVRVAQESDMLVQVMRLWRQHSQTLGFFPEGAFRDYAGRGWILAAVDEKGSLLGYLMYRVSHRSTIIPRANIVHLCVAQRHRRKGIASALVDQLIDDGKDKYLRLELRCRRDYEATDLWPKLGFIYSDERIGRAGMPVVRWHIPLRNLPLFPLLPPSEVQELYRVVIDANVFFRLEDELPEAPAHELQLSKEAKAIVADWLPEDLGIYITKELLNEIQRNKKGQEREKRYASTRQYKKLETNHARVREIEKNLTPLFPRKPSPSTQSDIRHLSHAIAGYAHFFITQDAALLDKASDIEERFNISVRSPGEFIIFIDESLREVDYQPSRLGGVATIHLSRVTARNLSGLYATFRCIEEGEKKSHFERQVRRCLATPTECSLEVVGRRGHDKHLLLIAIDRSQENIIQIPLLRISADPFARTILRHSIIQASLSSALKGMSITLVTDSSLQIAAEEALRELGFTSLSLGFAKVNLEFVGENAELQKILRNLKHQSPWIKEVLDPISNLLSETIATGDIFQFAELERILWPAKLSDAQIPSYVIPIRPHWAQHLFDEELAVQTLWGAKERLALSAENIYYRSARVMKNIEVPARILWYVIGAHGFNYVKQIRACSRLDQVEIGSASDLFRRFKRLGIYEWNDVLGAAGNDPEGDVMALRFSNTELLSRAIDLETYREILLDLEGKKPMLQSPMRLHQDTFIKIYKLARQQHC